MNEIKETLSSLENLKQNVESLGNDFLSKKNTSLNLDKRVSAIEEALDYINEILSALVPSGDEEEEEFVDGDIVEEEVVEEDLLQDGNNFNPNM